MLQAFSSHSNSPIFIHFHMLSSPSFFGSFFTHCFHKYFIFIICFVVNECSSVCFHGQIAKATTFQRKSNMAIFQPNRERVSLPNHVNRFIFLLPMAYIMVVAQRYCVVFCLSLDHFHQSYGLVNVSALYKRLLVMKTTFHFVGGS